MISSIQNKIPSNTRWFDIIRTKGVSTPISFKNNRIYSVTEKENSGYGFRININGRTGFSYTNDKNNIDSVIENAIQLSKYSDHENFSLPSAAETVFEPYNPAIESFDHKNEIDKAEQAIKKVLATHPQTTVDLTINCSQGEIQLSNSEGLESSYKNSYYSATISVTNIKDNGEKLDIWESTSSQTPVEYENIVNSIITRISQAKSNRVLQSGKLPIILSPKAVASFIGIVLSGLNARTVFKGLSPFADKTGVQVFSDNLSIYDNPLEQGSPYSYPFDDEGTRAFNKCLIENGYIKQFISDLKHANKLGIPASGNASRGYSSLPFPSFSNIVIANGNKGIEDMTKEIKHGILVEQFIGLGQSNTLTGDFSANLDLAYAVENGEITGRVKDCMLSDNIHSLLKETITISKEQIQQGAILCPYILLPAVNFTA